MIVDSHTHAGTSWFEPVETLIHQMDANGVQKAVLIQHGGMYDNAYLLDCAARHNGRFSVVGMVDEASSSATDDLAGWAERGDNRCAADAKTPLSHCGRPHPRSASP